MCEKKQIICCPLCPFANNNNIVSCSDLIECVDGAKIVKLRCKRFCYVAWYYESCVNNNVDTNSACANRHKRGYHSKSTNQLNVMKTDSTLLDVDEEFANDTFLVTYQIIWIHYLLSIT